MTYMVYMTLIASMVKKTSMVFKISKSRSPRVFKTCFFEAKNVMFPCCCTGEHLLSSIHLDLHQQHEHSINSGDDLTPEDETAVSSPDAESVKIPIDIEGFICNNKHEHHSDEDLIKDMPALNHSR